MSTTRVEINARELSPGERSATMGDTGRHDGGVVARERMAWWSRTFFGGGPLSFATWLALDGLSVESAVPLVERSDSVPLARGAFAWADTRHDALAAVAAGDFAPAVDSGLTMALLPYAGWALARLREGFDTDPRFPPAFRAQAEQRFVTYLMARLHAVAMPSLGLALHTARLTGTLTAATPQERSVEFSRRLGDPRQRALALGRFPVVDRVAADVARLATAATLLLLERIGRDANALATTFGVALSALTDVEFGQGDPHCGGRSVAILTFGATKIVYKPKSLAVDRAFNGLIAWLATRIDPSPSPLAVVACDDYGWTAFAPSRGCETVTQVGHYYRRLGALLALLHLCRGVDVHFENLVSDGDQPYAVDLETLLHRDPARPRGAASAPARRAAARNRTVLAVGLLPEWVAGAQGVFDLSAAGAIDEQPAPFLQPQFMGFDGDDPRIVYQPARIAVHANVPRLNDRPQPVTDFVDDIVAGFRSAYAALHDNRDALCASDGPLTAFADVSTRFVARPTMQYALMLRDSFHPTHMRDGIDHEMAFAALADGIGEAPHLRRLIAAEKRDLWSADIPYFTCRSGDCGLRDARGNLVDVEFFADTGAECLAERVRRLGAADLARQEDAVRTAITARILIGGPRQPDAPLVAVPGGVVGVCLDAAVVIGDDLVRRAIRVDDGAYWLGLVQRGELNYAAGILDDSLYDGNAGIAIFLAELARLSGTQPHRETARRALASVRRAAFGSGRRARIGAFDGWAGSLYAELRVGACLGDWPERRLRRILGLIRRAASFDSRHDVISGAAGAAVVALRLVGTAVADEAAATARACASRLAQTAVADMRGLAWPTGPQRRLLTGYAHGTAGIALALAAVAQTIGEPTFLDVARQALAFERATYDPAHGHWRDLRGSPPHATAWCHGAAGIALSRLALARHLDDPLIGGEIAAGIAAIVRHGGGGSHCLCHGTFGNIEPLLLDARTRPSAQVFTAGVLAEFAAEGLWRCGVAEFASTPGLMVGLAGIGHGLLRSARPDSVPSVLLLETTADRP